MEHLIIKKTPEITSVAACINADTGVGPSIASGNQTCIPSCADLPITPQNNKNDTTLLTGKSKPKKDIDLVTTIGSKAKITE
jgi:hypothetical protein